MVLCVVQTEGKLEKPQRVMFKYAEKALRADSRAQVLVSRYVRYWHDGVLVIFPVKHSVRRAADQAYTKIYRYPYAACTYNIRRRHVAPDTETSKTCLLPDKRSGKEFAQSGAAHACAQGDRVTRS